ncbi:MAG: MATE family efflux transporter [Clostridia bacterium]
MFIKNFFLVDKMIKPSMVLGELPGTKEAYKTSLAMAWPSALESVLIALIGSMDIMMVGSLGESAISAVGITTQPKFILLAVIMTLNMGVTAIVARRKGEGDKVGATKCLKQALLLCGLLSLILNVLGEVFAEDFLRLAGANDDYMVDALVYFRIILIGNFFSCINLTINAAQRGFGNTRISMVTNISANLVNILFNFLLINGIWIFPRWGVMGAAVATVIGNIVGLIIAIISVTRRQREFNIFVSKGWGFDKKTMKGIIKVWSSALVEQVFMRAGFFVYAAMVASLGTLAFATHQICLQLINISFAFGDGLGIASASLVGQNLGAKRPDIAMIYGKVGQRCALIIGIFLSITFILLRKQLIGLFSNEAEVIELGSKVVFVIALLCLAQTSQVVISGCLRGAGDAGFVAISSFISIAVVRTGLSYLFCFTLGWGLIGAWLGMFSDQFLRLILNFIRYETAKWTKIEL